MPIRMFRPGNPFGGGPGERRRREARLTRMRRAADLRITDRDMPRRRGTAANAEERIAINALEALTAEADRVNALEGEMPEAPIDVPDGTDEIIDVGTLEGAIANMPWMRATVEADGNVHIRQEVVAPLPLRPKRRTNVRTHIILKGGYKIYQGGKNKDKIPWKSFIKKLLTGRPLGKKTIRKYSEEIISVNNPENCETLIKTIKSHGDKFDYVLELSRAYNMRFKNKDEGRVSFAGLGTLHHTYRRTTFNIIDTETTLTDF